MSQFQNAVAAHALISGAAAGAAAACFAAYEFQGARLCAGGDSHFNSGSENSNANRNLSESAASTPTSAGDRLARGRWLGPARLIVSAVAIAVKMLLDIVGFFTGLSEAGTQIWLGMTACVFIMLTGLNSHLQYVRRWVGLSGGAWLPWTALGVLGVHVVMGIVAASVSSVQVALFIAIETFDLVLSIGLDIFGSCRRMMQIRAQFGVCAGLIIVTLAIAMAVSHSTAASRVGCGFVVDVCYDICLVLLMLQQTDGHQLVKDAIKALFGSEFRAGGVVGRHGEESEPLMNYSG